MFVLEKFDVLCFLETPVLRFALLPYYRRYGRLILQMLLTIALLAPQMQIICSTDMPKLVYKFLKNLGYSSRALFKIKGENFLGFIYFHLLVGNLLNYPKDLMNTCYSHLWVNCISLNN